MGVLPFIHFYVNKTMYLKEQYHLVHKKKTNKPSWKCLKTQVSRCGLLFATFKTIFHTSLHLRGRTNYSCDCQGFFTPRTTSKSSAQLLNMTFKSVKLWCWGKGEWIVRGPIHNTLQWMIYIGGSILITNQTLWWGLGEMPWRTEP